MKMSAFLFGAALMFWGWQTGLWVLALPMEAIFLASYFIHWRWNLSVGDYKKIGKFCLLLAIAVLVYLFTRNPSIYLIFAFFQWLPLIFFPLLAAGIYSINDRLDLRNQKEQKAIVNYLIYPYFAICIISASAANVRGYSFYIGMFVLVTLALWFVRSARFSPLIWLCLILIAASMGVVGHMGLYRLQGFLEQSTLEWFSDFASQETDPLKRTTAIGDIGSVKLSNRIVFRIKPEQGQLAPKLLRTATYNKYQSSMWVAANSQFTPVKSEANKMSWHLGERKAYSSTITISAHFERGEDLLKLPDGSFAVNQLPVARMEKNQYGTVKVVGEPGIISYRIEFGKGFTLDSSPDREDLFVPDREKPALDRIIAQLNLEGKSSQKILKEVESFFQREFEYSLELAQQGNNPTPLSAFLLENRSGHCEYFATATTLLLRRLGIPTRYAIGYSVHEFSQLENQFIVRGRHAHAWTLVYVDGAWQVLDTTPASWVGIENTAAPSWEFILDLLSFCWFKLSQIGGIDHAKYLWCSIVLFIFILVWRFKGKRRMRPRQMLKSRTKNSLAGFESELYLIEKALNKSGLRRDPALTWKVWIEKVRDRLPTGDSIEDLKLILELHYRDRFDPQGITTIEKARLKSLCQLWLDKYGKDR